MNIITNKMDKQVLAVSLLSISLASFPSLGILASSALAKNGGGTGSTTEHD